MVVLDHMAALENPWSLTCGVTACSENSLLAFRDFGIDRLA